MNKNQQRVLFLEAVAALLMLLFPPFHVAGANGTALNLGYGFILSPPTGWGLLATVDSVTLLVQWIGVLLIGGLLWFALRNKD